MICFLRQSSQASRLSLLPFQLLVGMLDVHKTISILPISILLMSYARRRRNSSQKHSKIYDDYEMRSSSSAGEWEMNRKSVRRCSDVDESENNEEGKNYFISLIWIPSLLSVPLGCVLCGSSIRFFLFSLLPESRLIIFRVLWS